MERYTSLEQALQDPSLVIITDNISSQIELDKIYLRYKVLPKRQKRFSSYYSNEFLGHNVPVMYYLMKEKLISDKDIFKDLDLPIYTTGKTASIRVKQTYASFSGIPGAENP